MGIDHSLTDDFPSIDINGTTYRYGRETEYGQYLVESAEYAKDYWCFQKREDLLAFLANLPESADRDWIVRRHPDWHDATHEQRVDYMEEHRAYLRQLMEEKEKDGSARWFNILQFDEEGSGYYSASCDPLRWHVCDDVEVRVREQEVADARRKEFLIELITRTKDGEPETQTFTVWRKQALKLASVLIQVAQFVEDRLPDPLTDEKKE